MERINGYAENIVGCFTDSSNFTSNKMVAHPDSSVVSNGEATYGQKVVTVCWRQRQGPVRP